MKHAAKIFWGMLTGSVLFIIIALGAEQFWGTSTEKFEVVLEDSMPADVIVITSKGYNKTQWKRIKTVIASEAKKSSDVPFLNQHITKLLIDKKYSIVTMFISRKVETFTMEKSGQHIN